MTKPTVHVLLLAGLLGASPLAVAQHTPLIERMSDASAPTTSPAADNQTVQSPAAQAQIAPTADSGRAQIGDTTRALLRMQAEGTHAGNALPMLGEPASRSYQRYLTSFDHPIPEYFETTVPTSTSGSGSH